MSELGIHRRTAFVVTESLIARFEKKVLKGESNECWPWTAGKRGGYGAIKHDGKVLGSHVVAFAIANGFVPSQRMIVRHTCDNSRCCNPSHLEVGTFADNVRDMDSRGRRRSQPRRGVMASNAKLTEQDVREIRARYLFRRLGYGRLGKLYGVSDSVIEAIIKRKMWAHVD